MSWLGLGEPGPSQDRDGPVSDGGRCVPSSSGWACRPPPWVGTGGRDPHVPPGRVGQARLCLPVKQTEVRVTQPQIRCSFLPLGSFLQPCFPPLLMHTLGEATVLRSEPHFSSDAGLDLSFPESPRAFSPLRPVGGTSHFLLHTGGLEGTTRNLQGPWDNVHPLLGAAIPGCDSQVLLGVLGS